MKYEIRYYFKGDKTRFFETTIEIKESCYLPQRLTILYNENPSLIIQKVTKQ